MSMLQHIVRSSSDMQHQVHQILPFMAYVWITISPVWRHGLRATCRLLCCHVQGGYVMPYMVDDQGFVAVRANSSHLVMHYYASSHQQPVYTAVLAHAGW